MPADAVKINANENPLGPCPEAAEAIYSVVKKGGRYMYEETFGFAKTLADVEGVKPSYVLHSLARAIRCIVRCSLSRRPTSRLVMGDPGYEAGAARGAVHRRKSRFGCR